MTNLEIDKALALAIGYLPEHVSVIGDIVKLYRPMLPNQIDADFFYLWKTFSHTDPSVIWPLAKHYKCFPWESCVHRGMWGCEFSDETPTEFATTPEEAVAMAIIKGSRK